MTAHVQIQSVLQHGLELHAQQAALGQHGAPLLHVPAEMGVGRGDHQCLTEEGAVLGAADVEHIRQRGQICKGQVVTRRGERRGKSGAVQEQQQAVLVAARAQSLQLRLGVNGADLGAVGDIDHLGSHHVLGAVVLPEDSLHQSGGELAVFGADGADLVAGGLDGAGLMGVHMAGMDGDHRLIGGQERRDGHQVGLGAAHQEMDVGVRRVAELADQVRRLLAVVIHAIAAGLLQVGIRQGLEYLGMGTFAVIVAEAVHIKNLLSFFVFKNSY